MIYLVRSLLLAGFFAFLVPVLLITGLLGSLLALGQVPGLESFSTGVMASLASFLQTFGSGSTTGGILVIGGACCLVGLLFDMYIVFYHQYNRAVHNHPMQ